MTRLFTTLFLASSLAAAFVGCNSLLGNEEGKPYADASVGAGDDATSATDAGPGDAGGDVVVADVVADSALQCDPGEVACSTFRACVKVADPNFGCGSASCLACNATNASAVACEGSDAGLRCKPTCNAGFKNCNGDPSDGCEADLTLPSSCGDCTRACDAGAPLCATVADGGFECVATCPPGQTKCGNQCVDLNTDPQNCKACGTACATAPNSIPVCSSGNCDLKCDLNAHACSGLTGCFPNNDAEHCGAACDNCIKLAPPHTSPSCQTNQCHFECNAGWGDCNGDLAKGAEGDGCETDLWADSKNCGKCLNACGTITINLATPYLIGSTSCCNGTCIPSTQACAYKEH